MISKLAAKNNAQFIILHAPELFNNSNTLNPNELNSREEEAYLSHLKAFCLKEKISCMDLSIGLEKAYLEGRLKKSYQKRFNHWPSDIHKEIAHIISRYLEEYKPLNTHKQLNPKN